MRRWSPAFIAALCVLALGWLINSSPSFKRCIHDTKGNQAYEALHEKSPLLDVALARLELHAGCARVTASENDGAITALATIVLAAFTLALWQTTNRLWISAEHQLAAFRRSLEHASAAAEAGAAQAAVAERMLVATLPPKLVVRRLSLEEGETVRPTKIEWIVANIGGSPATITRSNATIQFSGSQILEPIPAYNDETNSMGEITIEPGAGRAMVKYDTRPLRDWEDDAHAAQHAAFYLMGYIQYRDASGVKRFMAFCRRYNRKTRRFEVVGDPNYEYEG